MSLPCTCAVCGRSLTDPDRLGPNHSCPECGPETPAVRPEAENEPSEPMSGEAERNQPGTWWMEQNVAFRSAKARPPAVSSPAPVPETPEHPEGTGNWWAARPDQHASPVGPEVTSEVTSEGLRPPLAGAALDTNNDSQPPCPATSRRALAVLVGTAGGLAALVGLTLGALLLALYLSSDNPPDEGPIAGGPGIEPAGEHPTGPPKQAHPGAVADPGEEGNPIESKPTDSFSALVPRASEDTPKAPVGPRIVDANPPRPTPEAQPPEQAPVPPQQTTPPPPESAPPARPTFVYKRRRDLSEEDLKKQIARVQEVALDDYHRNPQDRRVSALVVVEARKAHQTGVQKDIIPLVRRKRLDLRGLPFLEGDECKSSPTAATHLEGGSLALRAHLNTATQSSARFVSADTRPDPKVLHDALNRAGDRYNKWLKPEAIPALQQLLMAENEAIREVLVDQLAEIEGKQASKALAKRALFDLNPQVRKRALQALAKRPADDFRNDLVRGLTYPWDPVADHAAEALVTLEMRDTVPQLVALLDKPDPARPFTIPGPKSGSRQPVVKELVRINHLRNCILCHAISTSNDDKVRGFVPPIDQALPPPFTRAYYAPKREGVFVRADITYLKQDFSVPLDVHNPEPWPATQRFDFMVRVRPANQREVLAARGSKAGPPSEQRKALFFALRELTGKDPGPTGDDWKSLFAPSKGRAKLTERYDTLVGVRGLASFKGQTLVSDLGLKKLLRVEGGRPVPVWEDIAVKGLAFDAKGQLLALDASKPPRLLALNLDEHTYQELANGYEGKSFGPLLHLATDQHGGIYFTAGPLDNVGRGQLYYRTPQGHLIRLSCDLARPTGVALSPDNQTLYVVGAGSRNLVAYPLESAGAPGKGKVLARLDGQPGTILGGQSITVDIRGNLYVTNLDAQAIQMFNPSGADLGLIPTPHTPRGCVIVPGDKEPTLLVATSGSLYTMPLGK
jgi:sugar lactone lactonase YvrE